MSIHCSKDGNKWTSIGAISAPSIKDNEYGAFTYEYNSKLGCNAVRFIKVKAKNYGECPAWHLGAGGTTWLFVDELIIN